jgi:ATP-dependent RNA helicase SUPV3L1/SUV3
MKKNIDIKFPHKWFPLARKIKRKIYYHMGPTNSGKTYEALTSLAKAKNGIYCAPLRLLAWEVIY